MLLKGGEKMKITKVNWINKPQENKGLPKADLFSEKPQVPQKPSPYNQECCTERCRGGYQT